MALESRLGEDFDVKPRPNGYSGPALPMYDETLECSYTEQRAGVQSVNAIAIISCREMGLHGANLCKIQSRRIREQTYLFHK